MILLGEYKIDIERAKVYRGKTLLEIEPQTYKLLLHFVDNPQVIIDRDSLINTLWAGRVVSENTINKHIGNLRKVLNDNPRHPKYIETVSKRGYRLVCPVDINGSNRFVSSISRKRHIAAIMAVIIFALLTLLAIFTATTIESKDNMRVDSFEVTRAVGIEFSPRAIPNRNEILFLRQNGKQNKNQLWYKSLSTNIERKVNIKAYELFKLIDIASHNGMAIVYFQAKGPTEQCNIYRASFRVTDALSGFEPLFECQSFQLYDIVYSKNEDAFYYSALKNGNQSAQIYQFQVSKNSHELIQQPSVLGSNHLNLDISPDEQKLLIMSADYKRNTTFYILEIPTNKLTKHKTVDYLITEAIWAHDSQHIFYSARPPSHELLRSKPDSHHESRVVNVSNYLSNDLTLFMDNQLLYATRQVNFVNEMIFSDTPMAMKPNNSIVYDTIPALFHHQHSYLFISNRTGRNQLYKGDLLTGDAFVLSTLPEHRVFLSMQMSPDDNNVLLADQNAVWRVPLKTLNQADTLLDSLSLFRVFDSDLPIDNVNWLSNDHFVVSTKHNKTPHVIFDKDKPTHLTLSSKWKYAFIDHSHLDSIYLVEKATGRIYSTQSNTLLKGKAFAAHEVDKLKGKMPPSYFDPQITGKKIYFMTAENKRFKLNQVSINEDHTDAQQSLDGYYNYDVTASGLMISHLQEIQGDVYRAVIH